MTTSECAFSIDEMQRDVFQAEVEGDGVAYVLIHPADVARLFRVDVDRGYFGMVIRRIEEPKIVGNIAGLEVNPSATLWGTFDVVASPYVREGTYYVVTTREKETHEKYDFLLKEMLRIAERRQRRAMLDDPRLYQTRTTSLGRPAFVKGDSILYEGKTHFIEGVIIDDEEKTSLKLRPEGSQ